MSTAVSPSFGQSVALVAEREITSKLQSKAFVISTLVLFALVLAGILFSGFAGGSLSGETKVAVTSDSSAALAEVPGLELIEVSSVTAAEDALRNDTVEAAVVADPASPTGYTVVTLHEVDNSLTSLLSVAPTTHVLEPSATDPFMRYIVSIGFGVLFMLAATMFGSTITQSVIEEKSTRVVEILISTISTRALLAGKVLGNTVLAMMQVIGIVVVTILGLTITGQAGLLSLLGAPMVWFAVFFLFGFILLAAMFAAAASMVSRQEDAGATTTPITMLIMIPYVLIILFSDNPAVLTAMSYVPFSAPVGMPMRLFLGEAQWWEPLLSLAILAVTAGIAIVVGAKIYDNTLLKMGSRVSLKDALKG
ncbi:ABC transporter permease [Microbacterium sp. NC79]|uniref:ABC transporter permease n=1 Tax=Microbacterium sp. NC79 TaxID=2851009 RepID=UPI001C2C2DDD|nr:ABC transporter permease [Microbacterium sp. NC79]MBV0895869.1 ABC transporter permease [Microbacterium sp. NC79]